MDYLRYKRCMDDARILAQEADNVLSVPRIAHAERMHKRASLLAKADKLRKLAVTYVFPESLLSVERSTR